MHNDPYKPDPEGDDAPTGSVVVYLFLGVCLLAAVMAALVLSKT